jgi:hypothetical protein
MLAMKSTLSFVLIACLLTSPFAGCATSRGPRQIDEVRPGLEPPTWDWSRVGEIRPATEIVVTTARSEPQIRYFVMADESRIITLNLTNATMPAASARVLRDLASQHPGYFTALGTTGTIAQGNVRIGRDGLFVANRKVADLEQIVETIARDHVSEIRGTVVARGSVAGAVLGGWIGFAVGAVPALGGAPDAIAWLVLASAVGVGGFLGFHWSSHETEGIVYRAR